MLSGRRDWYLVDVGEMCIHARLRGGEGMVNMVKCMDPCPELVGYNTVTFVALVLNNE